MMEYQNNLTYFDLQILQFVTSRGQMKNRCKGSISNLYMELNFGKAFFFFFYRICKFASNIHCWAWPITNGFKHRLSTVITVNLNISIKL